jgi:transposase
LPWATQLSNSIRGYAAAFGLVSAGGLDRIEPLLMRIAADETVPELAKETFTQLGEELAELERRISAAEKKVLARHRNNEQSRRLTQIPSVGPIGAALLVMEAPDLHSFESGRDFAARREAFAFHRQIIGRSSFTDGAFRGSIPAVN